MSNSYFNATGYPSFRQSGASSSMRAQLAAIAAGFDKLPTLAGNGGKMLAVNAGGTAVEAVSALDGIAIGGSTPAAGAFTTLSASGAATLAGTLHVTGAATFGAGAEFAGALSGITTLGASGAVTLGSTLAVTGAITATGGVTGNASTATALQTARTIGVSGVTGSAQSFNGSANITIPISAVPASLLTGTIDDDRLPSTITSAITGNAATATALATARTINGTSFNGTANITVAAAAGTLTGSTLAAGVTASSLTSVGTLSTLTVTGAVTAGGIELGYRGIPMLGASGGGTAATSARGKALVVAAALTCPSAVFSAGDTFSIINASGSAVSIPQGSGLTMYLSGTTSTGDRTLAARGVATVVYVDASTAYISGAGVS